MTATTTAATTNTPAPTPIDRDAQEPQWVHESNKQVASVPQRLAHINRTMPWRDHTVLSRDLAYHDGHLTRPAFISIAVMTFVTFLGNFTQLQLTSALPQIDHDFGIPLLTGQWLTSVFQLVLGIMVPLTAFLTLRFSTRQIVVTSMLCFTLGSVLAWLAPTFPLVLAGRILEAVGGGVMWPVLQIIIFQTYPPTHRGVAMGTVGIAMAVAPAFGPVLGGWQTDRNGWRSIFGSLAIVGGLAVLLVVFCLRNFNDQNHSARVDMFSVILSTLGFGGLLFGFTNIRQYPLTAPICWVPMLIGLVGIAWFVVRQLRMAAPLLDLRVLKNRSFAIGTAIASLSFFAFSSVMVLLAQYIQNDLYQSATISGLALLPGAFGQIIAQYYGGRFLDRLGARPVVVFGTITLLIGTVMMSLLSATTPVWWVSLCQFIRQIGMGFTMMPVTTWSLNALEPSEVSDGSAVTNTARQISGAIGSPVLIVIMEMMTSSMHASGMRPEAANISAIEWTFRISAIITLVMVVLAIAGVRGHHAGHLHTLTLQQIKEARRGSKK